MTDLSTLTDTELNERIGRLLGWKRYKEAHPQIDWASMPDYSAGWGWASPEGKREAFIPNYTTSLDALKSGPEKILRAQGWRITDLAQLSETRWRVCIWRPGQEGIEVFGPTEERARAEAVCLGLEASK